MRVGLAVLFDAPMPLLRLLRAQVRCCCQCVVVTDAPAAGVCIATVL